MTVLQSCTASNYGNGLIPTLLSNVDNTGCNYVQGAYQELARNLTAGGPGTSIASLLLILYVVFWAFGVWSGTATGSATDAAFRLFRAFVIYTLATSWSDFVSFAYTAFNDGPSAIGNRLLAIGNNNSYSSSNAIVSAMEAIWNQISQAYQSHVAFSLLNLGAYIVGIVCVVIIALFLAIGVFTIILSKVFLWLLLGIAPLMILALLFNVSSRFFSGWMNSVIQYAVLQMLVYAFLAFYLTVTQPIFANLATSLNSGSVDWAALAPFVLVGLTGLFLISQLPALAASISGGMPMYGMMVGGLWRGILRPPGTAAVVNARIPFIGWRGLNRSIADRQAAARVKRIYGDASAKALQDRLMKQ
jgi:type IV secretion system protein VirB6